MVHQVRRAILAGTFCNRRDRRGGGGDLFGRAVRPMKSGRNCRHSLDQFLGVALGSMVMKTRFTFFAASGRAFRWRSPSRAGGRQTSGRTCSEINQRRLPLSVSLLMVRPFWSTRVNGPPIAGCPPCMASQPIQLAAPPARRSRLPAGLYGARHGANMVRGERLDKRVRGRTTGVDDERSVLLTRAADYAARQHSGQRRKARQPSPISTSDRSGGVAAEATGADVVLLLAVCCTTRSRTPTPPTTTSCTLRTGGRCAGAEVSDDKSLRKEERKRLQIEETPASLGGPSCSNSRQDVEPALAGTKPTKDDRRAAARLCPMGRCRGALVPRPQCPLEADFDAAYQEPSAVRRLTERS